MRGKGLYYRAAAAPEYDFVEAVSGACPKLAFVVDVEALYDIRGQSFAFANRKQTVIFPEKEALPLGADDKG